MPRFDEPVAVMGTYPGNVPMESCYDERKPRFSIRATDKAGKIVADLASHSDCYAEQILRGLVHSGYTVTIKELE